jgi:hypothetical protein
MPVTSLVLPGNIDLYSRPRVKNADGSISTVRSMSFNDDSGKEVLIPTVVGNQVVSSQEAINHYYKTGEHLGIFNSPAEATTYAQQLHNDYAAGKYDRARMISPAGAERQNPAITGLMQASKK